MSRYEETYGTHWDTLDRDEAMTRAFALGVESALGVDHEGEFERILGEVQTSYDRSIVELAYEEGKQKASNEKRERDRDSAVWTGLIDETDDDVVTIAEDDVPTGGPNSLPSALSKIEVLEQKIDDTRDRVSRPDFLERE